ncbi:MAG: hypothetical protein NVS2B8_17320 [Vulcanimicrobiaceae bacterium]
MLIGYPASGAPTHAPLGEREGRRGSNANLTRNFTRSIGSDESSAVEEPIPLDMISHELLGFFALVASGIIGSLVATPLRNAMVVVVERRRPSDRR